MNSRTILASVVLFGVIGGQPITRGAETVQAAADATSAPAKTHTAAGPAWASDARWYQIDVAMFARGTPGHQVGSVAGDFKGLRNRLPYLKTLGANVLYLTSIFQPSSEAPGRVDWHHIDPALGEPAPGAPTSEPSPAPHAGGFTSGDRSFLAMVKAAHDAGFRVVLDLAVGDRPGSIGAIAPSVKDLAKLSQRWMDPDGDAHTSDGVDGWVVRGADALPRKFVKEWTAGVRARHTEALLVADADRASATAVGSGGFDARIDRTYARAIRDFVGVVPEAMSVKPFLTTLRAIGKTDRRDGRLSAPSALSDPAAGRFFRPRKPSTADAKASDTSSATEPSPGGKKKTDSPNPTDQGAARWRLATVLQHFLPGTPMTYYGDEIGLTGGPRSRVPMAWLGAAGTSTRITERHPEFASLIQWLHGRRAVDAPLRQGTLRVVFVDADRQVFALARTLPGDEVILVVNYGNTKRKVMLPVGGPGRLAAMLTPLLAPRRLPPALARRLPAPAHGITPLLMGASRQGVDNDGRIRVWVDPMAVRYILLQDR